MKSPRPQVHIQPLIRHLLSVPLVALPVHHVHELACPALQVGPWQEDAALASHVREIDDHKVFLFPLAPAPRHKVNKARVVRPAAPLAEAPLSLLEGRAADQLDHFVQAPADVARAGGEDIQGRARLVRPGRNRLGHRREEGEVVRRGHAGALAGFLLGVNPFDELAVTEAKQATTAILEGGASEVPGAQADVGGTWVTFAGGLGATTEALADRAAAMRAAIGATAPDDYLALLVYAPEDEARLAPLRHAASVLSRTTGRAVCLELGPRYLHSTGQLHKGGPNNGVFVLVTTRDRTDLEIPGKPFTLAALHRAQAEGDLVTLARHDRRVLRFDLPSADAAAFQALAADLISATRAD